MIEQLENFLSFLTELQDAIKKNKSKFISRSALRNQVESCSKSWLSKLSTRIRGDGFIDDQVLNGIDERFEKLLELATNNNRKSSYINLLNALPKEIQKTVLVPLIKQTKSTQNPLATAILSKIHSNLSYDEEKKYFEEATRAASNECYKAATIMVWCAIIDRLRKVIEKSGLENFNKMSKQLKARKTGYYKHFSKEFNLAQTNELQEVFDKDLITILSAMVNLDLNELKATLHLFDVRNHCAHPSSYIMDELAYINYLNEVLKLILANPSFK